MTRSRDPRSKKEIAVDYFVKRVSFAIGITLGPFVGHPTSWLIGGGLTLLALIALAWAALRDHDTEAS